MSKMCINCGQKLSDHAKFCDECGANAEDAVLIEDSPAASELVCPRCNTPLKPNAKFCGKCGTKLESSDHVDASENKPENSLSNTLEQSTFVHTVNSQSASSFSSDLPVVPPAPEQILQPGKHINRKTIQIGLSIVAAIIAVIVIVVCIAGKNNPPKNNQIIADLQEHDFAEYFIYNAKNTADIDNCVTLEYTITDLQIEKRDTADDYDTAWFEFTADNTKNQYTGTGTISYKKYTKGGWLYDGHMLDTYESKPIKEPDIDDVYESWNYDWIFSIGDDENSSVSVLDTQPASSDEYSYNPATATLAYTGTLDGGLIQLAGTFHVAMSYSPDNEYSSGEYVGWQCDNLDLQSVSSDISIIADISGRWKEFNLQDDLIITSVEPNGAIKGYVDFMMGYQDTPLLEGSRLVISESNITAEIEYTNVWYNDQSYINKWTVKQDHETLRVESNSLYRGLNPLKYSSITEE